jgi:hypothetical protein
MPEDVAMEHEGAAGGSSELDSGSSASDTDNITADRVDSVGVVRAHRFDDLHWHSVEMEWMGVVIISRWEDDSDGLVGGKDEGVFGGIEVSLLTGTSKDFIEGRGLRREIGDAVDVPLSLSGGDNKVEGKGDVRCCDPGGDEWAEISLNEGAIDGAEGHWGGRVSITGTLVTDDSTGESGVLVGVAGWVTTYEGSVEPVVVDGLVGVENDRVALACKHVNLLDGMRLSSLSVSLNDSQIVLVDGNSEDIASRLVDDAEAVALASDDVNNGPRDSGSAIEAATTIDSA